MEQIKLTQTGSKKIKSSVRVGNVGSGDLEVVFIPTINAEINITINTSINNKKKLWEALIAKSFSSNTPNMTVIINDFGATPGVITLRLEQALEQIEHNDSSTLFNTSAHISFIELTARKRANYLLDNGSAREVLGYQENIISPWLIPQGIVPQSDDGCVIVKGTIQEKNAVIIAIDGMFQGGAIGEVSGAKISTALELALIDNKNGKLTQVVILFETGGVRLQEANLGLAAIADIHTGIIALREYIPVIGIIAGTVGCFGGMSIAAGLCSRLIVTQEARLGLNGPAVIEQEAGIEEYDAQNRPFIWSVTGGEQRYKTGFADAYIDDNAAQIKVALIAQLAVLPKTVRCEQIERFIKIFDDMDKEQQSTPELVCNAFSKGDQL